MKKKLLAGALSAVLLIGGATAVWAAPDSAKLAELKSLTQQMYSIKKQILDKEVEAGLITQAQADEKKARLDQRQQADETSIANGQAPDARFGKGKRGDDGFKPGQPMTADQIKTWNEAMQKRLQKQIDAMKASGKFTDAQITSWNDAAQTQLKIQEQALQNGTMIPGGFGMPGGKGMRGGRGNCTVNPDAGTSSGTDTTNSGTTTN